MVRVAIVAVALTVSWVGTAAAQRACRPGYEWNRRVAGCVQTSCAQVQHAHLAHGGECVCGSSGSIRERRTDPNRECSHGSQHRSCPGCVYACVRPDQACPAPPGEAPRECNMDQAMLDFQRAAQQLEQRGRRLRQLMEADLPEFPEVNYCVTAGGADVSINVRDGQAAASRVESMVGQVESAVDLLGVFDSESSPTISQNLSLSVLRFLRGQVVDARTRSRGGNRVALEFMRDMQTMADNVERVRERMVCAVQTGVPEFYRDVRALHARAEELDEQIRANRSCARGLGDLLESYLRPVRRIHDWHAEGVLSPNGPPRGSYVTRRNWVDRRLDARRRPAVFAQYRCGG